MGSVSMNRAVVAAAALALLPAPALAKDNLADRAKAVAEQANEVQERAGALANEVANADAARDARDDRADRDDRNGNRSADDDDDGDGGNWGLLGLLGLAGLLGLRRRDDGHVHVDNRNPRV
jgi:MYXO-CTERM domain-containing protein